MYKNDIFVSVAEIDSGSFKGIAQVEALKELVRHDLKKYVRLARAHGFAAGYRMDLATEVVNTAAELCEAVVKGFPRSIVLAGSLVFRREQFLKKLPHHETAFAIERRLQWKDITTMILPIRVNF
jgi:hypothetical protein